jgi:hypothetical protein
MRYVTTGDIARLTGRDRDQISYALRKGGVEPIGRAGIVRLFPASAIDIVQEFFETRDRKEIRHASTK